MVYDITLEVYIVPVNRVLSLLAKAILFGSLRFYNLCVFIECVATILVGRCNMFITWWFGVGSDNWYKGHMRLGGYGVELAVKNMEYKAVDDRNVEAEGIMPSLS